MAVIMDEERPNKRFLHFTKDYEQKKVFDEQKNKFKHIVVYIGKYYCRSIEKPQLKRLKLFYTILVALGAISFFPAAAQSISMNSAWYTALAQTIWLIGGLLTVCSLIQFLTTSIEMTEKQYRASSVWLKRSSLITAVGAIALVMISVFYLLLSDESYLNYLLCVFLYLFCGVCFCTLFCLEYQMRYTVRQSEGGSEDEI